MPAWKKLQLSSYIKIGLLFFRLIDPQTQVTRLRVRWPQFLQFCLVSKIWVVSLLSLLTGILLCLAAVPSLHCGAVFVPSGQQEAVWFCSAVGKRAERQPSHVLHLWIQQRWREGCVSVFLFGWRCNTSFLLSDRLSSSCFSDLWQHRSGQADRLALGDGKDCNRGSFMCCCGCLRLFSYCCSCDAGP